MDVQHALAMGRSLMREHGLEGWTIVADRAKTRAGVCRFGSRQIGISAPLTRLHDEAEVRDTILHEIAHALVGPTHGHDAVWRAKATAIGGSGERCLSPEAPRLRGDWVGTCPNGHERTRHRAPTRVLSCARCSKRFDVAHVFTWTYRGRRASLPDRYMAELALLRNSDHSRERMESFELGTLVQVLAPGRWEGEVGEVETVGRTRLHVRLEDGSLISVRAGSVATAPPGAWPIDDGYDDPWDDWDEQWYGAC